MEGRSRAKERFDGESTGSINIPLRKPTNKGAYIQFNMSSYGIKSDGGNIIKNRENPWDATIIVRCQVCSFLVL